jgi:hypothetical protein
MNAALPLHMFENGKPFPTTNQIIAPQNTAAIDSIEKPAYTLLFKGSLSIFLFLIAGYLVLLIFHKTTWKQLTQLTLILSTILLFIFVLSLINPQQVTLTPDIQESTFDVAPFTYRTEPIQSPSVAWQWIAAITLFIGVGTATVSFLLRKPKPESAETQISRQAIQAMQSLQMGKDFRAVILYCYQEMTRVIQDAEELSREESMTVREFENTLSKLDIPISAITQLGRLFENARYNIDDISQQDQQLCLRILQEIIDHCQQNKGDR